MRLERLEIKGFKSFANQTVIHFKEDVTGVVGPNGSGKSNIVDAIRWVLGEQKQKDLRLEKMSDVIFNGTKKKKSSGMAYVALTFENSKKILASEYNTVTIARYLYNTGESEYRLNNVVCRLKDIRSLFLDTGIGSNSYAIIALGMVEDILADKENARRKMFEQAAGISKYKRRKRETLLKLNNTQADLDRVEDLLFEIEKNLKTLEKQAKRTQKYFDLKETYKALSLDLAVLKSKDLHEAYTSKGKRIREEEDAYRQLEVDLRNEDARVEALKKKHVDKEKSLSEFQRSVNDLINEIRTNENQKNILAQKKEFEQHNLTIVGNRIERNQIRKEEFSEQAARFHEEVENGHKQEEELKESLQQLVAVLETDRSSHGEAKDSVALATQSFQSKQDQVVQFEKELAVVESSLVTGRQEAERQRGLLRNRSSAYQEYEQELKEHQVSMESLAASLSKKEEEVFKQEQQREEYERQEDKLFRDLQKLRRSSDAKKHEHDLIKSLVDTLEGFPDSIKYLNKHYKWKKPAPLFSDLIYCSEDYRTVIEHFLENYLNHYVVKDLKAAAGAIQMLSDTQKGRANFFILDRFGTPRKSKVSPPDHAIAAIDVVEFDDKYAALMHNLLDGVFIVDFGESQASVLEGIDDSLVLLSKDGKYIQRGNILGGGSVGLFEGKKLGRKKNLKLLEKQLAKLEKEISQAEGQLDGINDKLAELSNSDQQEELAEERQQMEELKRKEVYLKSQLEHLENEESNSKTALGSLEERLQEWEATRIQLSTSIEATSQAMASEREALAEIDESYAAIAQRLADQTEQVNEKQIELIRLQGKLAATQKELDFATGQIASLSDGIAKDKATLAETQERLTDLTQQVSDLEGLLVSQYEERKAHEADLSGLESTYFEARKEISTAEDKVRQLHRDQSVKQQLVNELKDEFNELKFSMNNVAERLKIEFDISLDQIMEQHEPEEHNLEQLEERVLKIRNRISNYGEINPMAVEAYDEMHVRYESITQQRDDVLEARDSLMQTIEEIETTATERFMEAFTTVRGHFQNVFRSLFTEDDACDLILVDPRDPLTSTIEIIAKPKGKRPKSISQLSGGEKTLTAIALLFGLYLLKPAPFCIFDEVDAPLDDSNVEKFNNIIREFSKESQFIVVTHNKLTMAAVDVIYGVYMEEQGISGVTEVDFRNFEHTSFLEVV
ncbi:MAG: chromosome segregation protein SMC [Saprospiraceae bacterium]|nr:chromosome segregation protein SMC [Saprospiraceae bacterium]